MAGLINLSSTEKSFILDGVNDDYRADGRSNIDYRPLELETDVVSHASGSARLRLANTDILVGIKTEIAVPLPEKEDLGIIEFFVDCSANATPEFEGRGGEQLANSISNIMQNAYRSSQAFDLKQLCILEDKQCWKLYVDILILECGGNLYDAVSLAVKAALFNTNIPLVKAVMMDGGDVDLQLSDDPYDSKLLDIGCVPLLVTLCKIGSKCVVDPSAEEESCSFVSLIVGVTGNPSLYCDKTDTNTEHQCKCSTISMFGHGSLAPQSVKNAIIQGIEAAKSLDSALARILFKERKQNTKRKIDSYGFLH